MNFIILLEKVRILWTITTFAPIFLPKWKKKKKHIFQALQGPVWLADTTLDRTGINHLTV